MRFQKPEKLIHSRSTNHPTVYYSLGNKDSVRQSVDTKPPETFEQT